MKNAAIWAWLVLCGLLLGAGNFVYPYLGWRDHQMVWNLIAGAAAAASVMATSRRARVTHVPSLRLLLLVFLACVFAVQYDSAAWWPNSADEYGYTFLAHTLLRGRAFNSIPPIAGLFNVAWICVRDGKWFSQYPPGWPAVLAPFLALGVPWLINPLLSGTLVWLEWKLLLRLHVPRARTAALCAMLALSPFVLFNAASLFSHVLLADLILAAIWFDMTGRRVAAGAAFGAMLLTRYEGFLLATICFAAWRLGCNRAALVRDAALMVAGGLPFIAVCLAYNLAITGHAFQTPYAWASGGAAIGLPIARLGVAGAVGQAIWQSLHWASELIVYAGLPSMTAVAIALVRKGRQAQLCWFDGLLPCWVVFFLFYPANGGHEFGPRYWFAAWPSAMLTIGTGLGGDENFFIAGRLRLHALSLASATLAVFLGATMSLAAFNAAYVAQRRAVYAAVPPRTPALILIPSRQLRVSAWQAGPIAAWADDFARNGVDLSGPVLFGMADEHFADGPVFTARACAQVGRSIYRWNAGALLPVQCARNRRSLLPDPGAE